MIRVKENIQGPDRLTASHSGLWGNDRDREKPTHGSRWQKKKLLDSSANERKYTQIKILLVGWDKALPFPAINATNACNVPYAGLQLFNINIFRVLCCVYLRSFAEKNCFCL